MGSKPVVYQLVVRYFGNVGGANAVDGDLATNGCGKFGDVDAVALARLAELGVTHLWLTGVLRQATLTDYAALGLPADPPEVVKGRAGSFFAVRDVCDVCPDYAADPARRMEEFEALVQRIHAAGLRALVDLVPNHVSRNHASANPACDFGAGDDPTRFFDPRNAFFYLADPPGQALTLPAPPHWHPPGVTFRGTFEREDGRPGHTPRATGDNVADPCPQPWNWYEVVKLNYGWDFVHRAGAYEPTPRTWGMVDAALAFWQAKGVDGFRCDFAHYVPPEAWAFLIGRARARRPGAWFMAEAYPSPGSGDPVERRGQLLAAGFDAVYHYKSYEALKEIYRGAAVDAYDLEMRSVPAGERGRLLEYLENHDERRIPSPIAWGVGSGESGFGSAEAGRQLAPLQFLAGPGPILLLNGQEVGEPGEGATGFKLDNGRTTIFDYWRMPRFALWVNGHRYDGGGLDARAAGLRRFYADLLALCADPAVLGEGHWSLRYACRASSGPGGSDWLYPFARFAPGSGRLLVVVANLRPGSLEAGRIRIPPELADAAGLRAEGVRVRLVLDEGGRQDHALGGFSRQALAEQGFEASISDQACNVYAVE